MSEEKKQQAGLHPTAYELKDGEEFVPYVNEKNPLEFTIKSVAAGIVLGILFGAANAYLGLMAGLTISTSIPVAVMTVVVFRALGLATKRDSGILEANMSQTIGSASSSVASGVLFTIPALFMWELDPDLGKVTILAMAGGLIGVLCMIPLRQYLIKREHGKLPYPEGLACAEVLVASDKGGRGAIGVFWGLGIGALFKLLTSGLKIIGSTFQVGIGKFVLAIKVSPALIGVGYILGPRISSVMVAGSALSAFVIIPFIAWYGQNWTAPLYPETNELIKNMNPGDIWEKYVRYIGAGAVGAAGILTLIRSLPVMFESFKLGLGNFSQQRQGRKLARTDRDIPLPYAIGAVGIILAILVAIPGLFGYMDSVPVKIASAALIGVFSFFFVTVASRIVGLVGVTSNPTSGMTIATLLATSVIFYLMGWTGIEGKATALMIGTVVCIAASISGDTSQDLKTGFLLGATPYKQQLGELAGVLASAFFVCLTVFLLHESVGIGSKELPAPQAQLMKVVIDGVIDQNLPWNLILIGVGIAIVAAVCRLPVLPFAVGVYLPLSTMAAVFLGGMLRWIVTRKTAPEVLEERRKSGVLFSSGLVGGEGLLGVFIAMFVLLSGQKTFGFELPFNDSLKQVISLVAVCVVLLLIATFARKKFSKTSEH